jgi:two-component system, OmpR family, phosphate regulon sensor histidine kinase PhoR
MIISSRKIAVFISLLVAAIISAFLYISPLLSPHGLLILLGLTFLFCFVLVFLSFEALVFREINAVYAGLESVKRKEIRKISSNFLFRPDPLKKIKQEIYQLAEQKQREIDELKMLQALRREFLADVSHELKTPIFAAQGFIHTLLDGAVDDDKVRYRFLERAAKSLDGLDSLVQDLISISQLEKGVVKMNFSDFDLVDLVQEVFEQLEMKAAPKNIHLHLELKEKKEQRVIADRNRIRQVFINLIDNAIKYGRQDGNIWVSFSDSRKKIQVMVRDDGAGIPREHQNRIFERFYRIDKSRSRESGSLGLGLAISKHIVEAHRSVIAVSSEVGKGTLLRFKLQKAQG